MNGKDFFDGWKFPAISGFVNGAYSGYKLSDARGLNYWWGKSAGFKRTKWSFFNMDKTFLEVDFKTISLNFELKRLYSISEKPELAGLF